MFQLQLNCSYLHHNVKGVLVEQEHKKQRETLFSDSLDEIEAENKEACRPRETFCSTVSKNDARAVGSDTGRTAGLLGVFIIAPQIREWVN